ncbi:MAG TPA: glycosyltransferase [Nocardioidaceae bacterium]|nr:glycosyltransferase [Nocardioidaceae bacterium]
MRIAMVSEHANPLAALGGHDAGGQNVYVAALAGRLARRGHEVTVFTRRDDASAPLRITAPDGYVVEHVPAGPPTEIPKDELLGHMSEFAQYLRLRWLNEKFDIVHSHFWMSGLAAVDAAEASGLPVVHTFHALGSVKRRFQGNHDTSPASRVSLEARLCRTVDHVLATCDDEVQELVRLGLDPGTATVVPCGVDVDLFRPTGSVEPTAPGRQLLTVGRLVERKGTADIIRALQWLPGAELTIAGGPSADSLVLDPEVIRLTELAQSLGVKERVHFAGSVSHEQMPQLFNAVDVVVTVPWYEPFGIVPLEAMACGRPVVGSAVGGLLDTVVPGKTGELVPPHRPDLLAQQLRRLLEEPARRAAYGEAGRRRVHSRYRWEEVARRMEQVYDGVSARVTSEVVS